MMNLDKHTFSQKVMQNDVGGDMEEYRLKSCEGELNRG